MQKNVNSSKVATLTVKTGVQAGRYYDRRGGIADWICRNRSGHQFGGLSFWQCGTVISSLSFLRSTSAKTTNR